MTWQSLRDSASSPLMVSHWIWRVSVSVSGSWHWALPDSPHHHHHGYTLTWRCSSSRVMSLTACSSSLPNLHCVAVFVTFTVLHSIEAWSPNSNRFCQWVEHHGNVHEIIKWYCREAQWRLYKSQPRLWEPTPNTKKKSYWRVKWRLYIIIWHVLPGPRPSLRIMRRWRTHRAHFPWWLDARIRRRCWKSVIQT